MSAADPKRQLCTFRVEGRTYGVDVLTVQEVHPQQKMTAIAHAPPAVRGLVNVRGQVYLVLDLARLLGGPRSELRPTSHLFLFTEAIGPAFGVLADEVLDVVDVELERRMKAHATNDSPGVRPGAEAVTEGVYVLPGGLVVELSPRRMLTALQRPSGAEAQSDSRERSSPAWTKRNAS